jgi:hypothetical protein
VTRRFASVFALVLAVGSFAGSSAAAPEALRDPKKPTLVAGAAQRIAGAMKVGEDGAEWLLPGGSRLTASPGAELRVLGVPQPVILYGKKVPGYTVLVRSGLVRASVPGTGKSAVVLSAPKKTSVLVASGETSVVAGRQVAVGNAEGVSSVGSAGESFRLLEPGTLEVVDDGSNARRALVTSPSALRGAFVVVCYGNDAALGEITWDAVPEANGYRAELRDAATGRVVARETSKEPRLSSSFARVAPGKYTLSVVSVDRTGLESNKPAAQPVRVIGLTLPAGGYVDGAGAVRFPAGTDLPLSNVEGVEMTYGSSDAFMTAPSTLEMFLGEPRRVRFRIAGTALDSSLWLVPRDERARIEFGPKTVRWPHSPLEIRIRIEDGSGRLAPDFIEARPKVLVGVEPMNVAFAREGQWLRGVLPARPGNGPWVVRVEVHDQNGIALGRDFIEIAATQPRPLPAKRGS